jgi:hypothetical protein
VNPCSEDETVTIHTQNCISTEQKNNKTRV